MSTEKSFLVIGGCGYVGSHMVKCLQAAGHNVIVLDDLSSGFSDSLSNSNLIEGNFGNRIILDDLFSSTRFDGVLHFASFIQVGESVIDPAKYYNNNMANTLCLLTAMKDHGVGPLIFSSTAAVFGEPSYTPIDEAHARLPINPYGMSKYMVEIMLRDFDRAYGLRSVALRYFNAAGADPQARIGERHTPETHLIPLALQSVLGSRPPLKIFGTDYATPDGTCIRDYIHVTDLAEAHLRAFSFLSEGGKTTAFNLGNGSGFSVKEVIDMVAKVTGLKVPVEYEPRREGDPARLVADPRMAKTILNWTPQYSDLETIVRHAWEWEKKRSLLHIC